MVTIVMKNGRSVKSRHCFERNTKESYRFTVHFKAVRFYYSTLFLIVHPMNADVTKLFQKGAHTCVLLEYCELGAVKSVLRILKRDSDADR